MPPPPHTHTHMYLTRPPNFCQPYKTQQRLAIEFATLCAALAFNAACFGPATDLFSGDFSVSFGASVCMLVIHQICSQLYMLSAQWAAEKHSTWSTSTMLTHALVASVAVGSIFLCLVYSVQFDAGVTARWFSVVLMSFAQSIFLTGPLWTLFKLGVYVLLARFGMRGMTPGEQRRALAVGDKGVITADDEEAAETGAKHSTSPTSLSLPSVEIEMSAVVVGTAGDRHVNTHVPATIAATQNARQTRGGFVSFEDDDDDSSNVVAEQQHANHLPASIISVAATTFANPLFASNQNDHQRFDDDEINLDGNDGHAFPADSASIASRRQSYHQQFDLVSIPASSAANHAHTLASRPLDDGGHENDRSARIGDGHHDEPSSRGVVLLHPNALFAPAFSESHVEALAAMGVDEALEAAPDAAQSNGAESSSEIEACEALTTLSSTSGSVVMASVISPHHQHPRAQRQSRPMPALTPNTLFDSASARDVIEEHAIRDGVHTSPHAESSIAAQLILSSNSLFDSASEAQLARTPPTNSSDSDSHAFPM